jgi:hypothetical protein
MRLQLVAVQPHQALPIDVLGNRRRLVEGWPALLIRHLKKQQKGQLLDIIPVRQAVIAQDVAVVPEFLNKLCGLLGHAGKLGCDDRLRDSNDCSKLFEVTIEGESVGDTKTLHYDSARTIRKTPPFIVELLKYFPGRSEIGL